jgi:hypothetical protein
MGFEGRGCGVQCHFMMGCERNIRRTHQDPWWQAVNETNTAVAFI